MGEEVLCSGWRWERKQRKRCFPEKQVGRNVLHLPLQRYFHLSSGNGRYKNALNVINCTYQAPGTNLIRRIQRTFCYSLLC